MIVSTGLTDFSSVLNGQITVIEENINNIYGNIATINENIDGIDSSVNGINTHINTIDGNINTIDGDIIRIDNNIGVIDGNITTINSHITTLSTHVDTVAQEQHNYTDEQITELRNEGYIQKAVTQVIAWIVSDEGKRFRKKVWSRIKNKWLTFTGKRPFTELLDDIENATVDELDEMLSVYRYANNIGGTNWCGIRTDAIANKEIVMNRDTYIGSGNLHLTGLIKKGTLNFTTGVWTETEILNDYFVIKGVKDNSCLDINTTTKKIQLNYDTTDFTLGTSPTYNLTLANQYKITGITAPISKGTDNHLKFDYDTDFFQIVNSYFTPKFGANSVVNPLYIEAGTKNLKLDYDTEYLDITLGKLTTKLLLKGIKTGNPLKIGATTKLLEFVFDEQYFTSTGFTFQPKLKVQGILENHCIDTDINEKLKLKYDTNDFELSANL